MAHSQKKKKDGLLSWLETDAESMALSCQWEYLHLTSSHGLDFPWDGGWVIKQSVPRVSGPRMGKYLKLVF